MHDVCSFYVFAGDPDSGGQALSPLLLAEPDPQPLAASFLTIQSPPAVAVYTSNASTQELGGRRPEIWKPAWPTYQEPVLKRKWVGGSIAKSKVTLQF